MGLATGSRGAASMDVVRDTKLFIATYGARPSRGTSLGKRIRSAPRDQRAELRKLVEGCATLQKRSIANADRLLTASNTRPLAKKVKLWAQGLRWRGKLRESALSRAFGQHEGLKRRPPPRPRKTKPKGQCLGDVWIIRVRIISTIVIIATVITIITTITIVIIVTATSTNGLHGGS